MRNCRMIKFKGFFDERGGLVAIENNKNLLFEINKKSDIISSFINNFINYIVNENSGENNLHKTQIYTYAMNVEMRLNVIFLINYMISTTQKTIDILLSIQKLMKMDMKKKCDGI